MVPHHRHVVLKAIAILLFIVHASLFVESITVFRSITLRDAMAIVQYQDGYNTTSTTSNEAVKNDTSSSSSMACSSVEVVSSSNTAADTNQSFVSGQTIRNNNSGTVTTICQKSRPATCAMQILGEFQDWSTDVGNASSNDIQFGASFMFPQLPFSAGSSSQNNNFNNGNSNYSATINTPLDTYYRGTLTQPVEVLYRGCLHSPVTTIIQQLNAEYNLALWPLEVVLVLSTNAEVRRSVADARISDAQDAWLNFTFAQRRRLCVTACFGGAGTYRATRDIVIFPDGIRTNNIPTSLLGTNVTSHQVACACVPFTSNATSSMSTPFATTSNVPRPSVISLANCLLQSLPSVLRVNFYCAPAAVSFRDTASSAATNLQCPSGCQLRSRQGCCYPGTFKLQDIVDRRRSIIHDSSSSGDGDGEDDGNSSGSSNNRVMEILQWTILSVVSFGVIEFGLFWLLIQSKYFHLKSGGAEQNTTIRSQRRRRAATTDAAATTKSATTPGGGGWKRSLHRLSPRGGGNNDGDDDMDELFSMASSFERQHRIRRDAADDPDSDLTRRLLTAEEEEFVASTIVDQHFFHRSITKQTSHSIRSQQPPHLPLTDGSSSLFNSFFGFPQGEVPMDRERFDDNNDDDDLLFLFSEVRRHVQLDDDGDDPADALIQEFFGGTLPAASASAAAITTCPPNEEGQDNTKPRELLARDEAGIGCCPVCLEPFAVSHSAARVVGGLAADTAVALGDVSAVFNVGCKHRVHRSCLTQYVGHMIRRHAKGLMELPCPVFGCKSKTRVTA